MGEADAVGKAMSTASQFAYEITLEGHLDDHWSQWFEGMSVTAAPNGQTILKGVVADQAALHGTLARIRDLGLVLLSLRRNEAKIETKE